MNYRYWGTSEMIEELNKRGVLVDDSYGDSELIILLIKTDK